MKCERALVGDADCALAIAATRRPIESFFMVISFPPYLWRLIVTDRALGSQGSRNAIIVSCTAIKTYCLPSLPRYVIGLANASAGSFVSHRSLPVLDS